MCIHGEEPREIHGSMRRLRAHRPRGFTLLEVVTALAVISLVAISALALVGQQVHVAAHARQVIRAEGLAEQRMAMLRMLRSYEVQSLPDTIAGGRFAPPNDDFTWHVTSLPVINEDNLNDIRIDVRWDDGTYTLRSRLYKPPAADSSL